MRGELYDLDNEKLHIECYSVSMRVTVYFKIM